MKRVLNWRPSHRDHRDLSYALVEHTSAPVLLPPQIDLRPFCPPIQDQGDMGSCSGHAAAGAIEFLELQELKLPGTDLQEYIANQFTPVSRLFIYWNERAIEGSTKEDAGATTLRDACKVATTNGVCRESLWPYSDKNLLPKPNQAAYADALKHKVTAYYALDGAAELKRCLANGYPFMFGASVYTSFMSAQGGHIPLPSWMDRLEGGHALLCVGYDDLKHHFIFRNSWGTHWGDQGYGYLPYSYMLNPRLTDDFFTLRRVATATP